MNLDYLNYLKEKKGMVSIALIGISASLAILILIKVAGFFVASARAEGVVKNAVAQSNDNDKDMETFFAESKAIADELKRKNLFAPPPPKQQPIKQVWGILGNEVLINDKWYKVGDMIQDAKIVAIEPTRIKVEWDGKEIALAPIDTVSSSPVGPKPKGLEVAKAGTGGRAEMVAVRPEGMPMLGQMRERFESMSEAERERLRREAQEKKETFMRMSEQERKKLMDIKEKWTHMSEEERGRVGAYLREKFGGGGGGGKGPGGGQGQGGKR